MAKQRGYPDRRGMGAPSDFISETFVPNEQHSSEQLTRAMALVAAGFSPEQVASMLSVPVEWVLEKSS
ncbi:MAG TPA: hypothetical protein VGM11_10665 [Acidobacteriaceae bacterium]|jgi:hypothetical protein